MHMNLIERSKQKVIEANEMKFKGFFSPRLLRKKAHNFAMTRIKTEENQIFKPSEKMIRLFSVLNLN